MRFVLKRIRSNVMYFWIKNQSIPYNIQSRVTNANVAIPQIESTVFGHDK
jgi:hypothetical protein